MLPPERTYARADGRTTRKHNVSGPIDWTGGGIQHLPDLFAILFDSGARCLHIAAAATIDRPRKQIDLDAIYTREVGAGWRTWADDLTIVDRHRYSLVKLTEGMQRRNLKTSFTAHERN